MKTANSLLLIIFGFVFFLAGYGLGLPQWQSGLVTGIAVTCVVLAMTMERRSLLFRGILLMALTALWALLFAINATVWNLSPLISMLLAFMTTFWLGSLARVKTPPIAAAEQWTPSGNRAPQNAYQPSARAGTDGLDLMQRKNEVDTAIQVCILHAATEPAEPDDAALHFNIARANPRLGELLRHLQIGQESLQIALKSKNRDTAESRIALAQEKYGNALADFSDLLAPATRAHLDVHIRDGLAAYNTYRYINESKGLLEKAASLKTEKARARYRSDARAIIQEGLLNPLSDKDRLSTHLAFIGDD